ncbi:DoxX family protein [Speluncibacter jeojiensis]|uniref:DoxX family protein n=1 Tax=Speluncibacter jeojiensis TaxID=2710754 RepID=A0A9X4M0I7_9ACTN|nr:DoxX family protein [Corynebacteriales bacterium D3-21]
MNDDARDQPEQPANPEKSSDPGVESGSSPFDEPTEQIPVEHLQAQSGSGTLAFDRTQVLSTEADLPESEKATVRLPMYDAPSYEDLTTARREPESVVAEMDSHLEEPPQPKRGTIDLGLLLLRIAIGGVLIAHGLQKLFGWWNGPGIDGFRQVLVDAGYQHAHALAIAGPVTELVAGVLLVLGLLTPVGAAAAVGVMVNAWCFTQAAEPGFQFFVPKGVEYPTVVALGAAAIALTGPGRIALDYGRKWATRPFLGSLALLVLGVAGGVAMWVVFNDANPFR